MTDGGVDLPRKQRKVLIELKRVFDEQGPSWIGIDELVMRVGMGADDVAQTLQLLKGQKLVDWHWFHATPWYGASEGAITAEGYNLAHSYFWTTKLSTLGVGVASVFVSSSVAVLINYALSPQGLFSVFLSIVGGTGAGFSLRTVLERISP